MKNAALTADMLTFRGGSIAALPTRGAKPGFGFAGEEKIRRLTKPAYRSSYSGMARPQGITDDEVLAAARVVFLAKGISATVEEVAERCHVGVATIFRRFPTKAALFAAAMTVSNDAEWERYLARRAERGDNVAARESLMELAQGMLDFSRKMMPLFMMKMSNPSVADREASVKRMSWLLREVAELFKLEMAAGRMVAMDSRVAARIWMGAIRQLAVFESLGANADGLTDQEFLDGLVDMFCVSNTKSQKKSK